MLLAQIEGFLEIARQGSMSRAADVLFVTQPALTVRIRQLEEELGVQLFVRTGRGVQLTEAGHAFLPYAERAIQALRGGRELVAEMREGQAGELTIGTAPAVGTYVLPFVLLRFSEELPRVQLVVRTDHSEQILDMVLRGEVQVGLVRPIRHPLIEAQAVYEDELVLVVDPHHPFASQERVALDQFDEARLIMFDKTSSYHELTQAMFRQAGVTPRLAMELDNIEAAKKMVQEGLGVALLPATAVAGELERGVLRSVPIDGAVPIRRRILAIRRRDSGPPSAGVRTFMRLLEEVPATIPGARPIGERSERDGAGAAS